MRNLCHFKPPGLLLFITAEIENEYLSVYAVEEEEVRERPLLT